MSFLFDNVVFFTIIVIFSIYFIYLSIGDAKNAVSKLKRDLTQPSDKSICPDYWDLHLDKAGNITCVDTQQLGDPSIGNGQCSELNFNKNKLYNMSDVDKCNWSTQCRIPWVGYDKIC